MVWVTHVKLCLLAGYVSACSEIRTEVGSEVSFDSWFQRKHNTRIRSVLKDALLFYLHGRILNFAVFRFSVLCSFL